MLHATYVDASTTLDATATALQCTCYWPDQSKVTNLVGVTIKRKTPSRTSYSTDVVDLSAVRTYVQYCSSSQ